MSKPPPPSPVDPYSQRFHALSLAATANLEYKTPEEIIKAAEAFHQYLTGEKK